VNKFFPEVLVIFAASTFGWVGIISFDAERVPGAKKFVL
jgi:hypothetical protein